jgi:transposase
MADRAQTCSPLCEVLRGTRLAPAAGHDPATLSRRAIRTLARRWLALTDEINAHNKDLDGLFAIAAPNLFAELGVSRDVAAKLVTTAGDHPERVRSESSFGALCGVSPISESSVKSNSHRRNRAGDRQANNVLWTVARVRLIRDPETVTCAEQRITEGLTHREIVRYPHTSRSINVI